MSAGNEIFTADTVIREIESLKPFEKYLIYDPYNPKDFLKGETFASLQKAIPAWNADSMMMGIKRLLELSKGKQILHKVYDEMECCDDKQKKDVVLFDFSVDKNDRRKNAPFIIVAAGGGYETVCSMVEAFSTAAHFNGCGYHVFVLNYRVGRKGVMPKPLEDLAAAYRYICAHAEVFSLDSIDYAVCGFSAGANLTCLWGTKSCGYARYGIAKPKLLIPVYPVVDLHQISETLAQTFPEIMLGKGYTDEKKKSYNVPDIFDEEYPPCYIVHCRDDTTVPVENSMLLRQMLEKAGISAVLDLGEKGEHGFGDGGGSDVEGWPKRAMQFFAQHIPAQSQFLPQSLSKIHPRSAPASL